jgi:tRNA(Ile)-lysidine synthetase-like protein
VTVLSTEKKRCLTPIWSALERFVLPHAPQGIALAVSGGADSRLLLESIGQVVNANHKILALTVDHAVRPESALEASEIVARSKMLGFHAKVLSMSWKDAHNEGDLRSLRYDALKREAFRWGCQSLVLAHTQSDNAEGFFLHLLGKGGGNNGAAMEVSNENDSQRIIRPFLGLSRKDVLLALTALGVSDYFVDPLDKRGLNERGFARNVLLPVADNQLSLSEIRLANLSELERTKNGFQAHDFSEENWAFSPFRREFVLSRNLALRDILNKLKKGIEELSPQNDKRKGTKELLRCAKLLANSADQIIQGLDPALSSVTVHNTLERALATVLGIRITQLGQKVVLEKKSVSG